MKLEAGKWYKMRDGRIAKCVAIWTEPISDYQATMRFDRDEVGDFTIDGKFNPRYKDADPEDLISEYVFPPVEPRRVWLFEKYKTFTFSKPVTEKPEDWAEFVEVMK